MKLPRFRFTLRWMMVAVAVVVVLLVTTIREEVEIQSGRSRSGIYVSNFPVLRFARDTALTHALPPGRGAGTQARWHRINTFTLLSPSVSPHHAFHLAGSQIEQLDRCWGKAEFTPSAKRASAEAVTRLWGLHGHYYEAGEYIQALRMLVGGAGGKTIDIGDLPPLP